MKTFLAGAALVGAGAWAVAPRSFNDRRKNFVSGVPDVWYAHRGLHDAGSGLSRTGEEVDEYIEYTRKMAAKAGFGDVSYEGSIAPENSLASFAAACEAGYGIELDIQITDDLQVVVCHDSTLQRVAGVDKRISESTYDELKDIVLFPAPNKAGSPSVTVDGDKQQSYEQHVPLLSDVLELVNGRVPLIIEYKFDDNTVWNDDNEEFMRVAHEILSAYNGDYVIESFHPGALLWYRRNAPEITRGQLASKPRPITAGVPQFLLGSLACNFLSRPDFIAYNWTGDDLPQVRAARNLGALNVSWTVRSHEELNACHLNFDRHIFECFIPDSVHNVE